MLNLNICLQILTLLVVIQIITALPMKKRGQGKMGRRNLAGDAGGDEDDDEAPASGGAAGGVSGGKKKRSLVKSGSVSDAMLQQSQGNTPAFLKHMIWKDGKGPRKPTIMAGGVQGWNGRKLNGKNIYEGGDEDEDDDIINGIDGGKVVKTGFVTDRKDVEIIDESKDNKDDPNKPTKIISDPKMIKNMQQKPNSAQVDDKQPKPNSAHADDKQPKPNSAHADDKQPKPNSAPASVAATAPAPSEGAGKKGDNNKDNPKPTSAQAGGAPTAPAASEGAGKKEDKNKESLKSAAEIRKAKVPVGSMK